MRGARAGAGAQSKADRLQTNDQVLSLTDQMNLGVRFVELDTHWVQACPPPPYLRQCGAARTSCSLCS